MTSYTVHFYADSDWACRAIEAETPDQALALARQCAAAAPDGLDFQPYDSTGGIEHIEVTDPRGDSVAAWHSHDLTLRLPETLYLDHADAALPA